MGLDMYLKKRVYVGANFEHNEVKGKIELESRGKPVKINFKNVTSIIEEVAYWRKANAIHNWFVQNVQDDVDNCAEYYVSFEQLVELRETCINALETKNADLLEPVEGFFFGSTEIDDYYWNNIKYTIEALSYLNENASYFYSSSW